VTTVDLSHFNGNASELCASENVGDIELAVQTLPMANGPLHVFASS
jgi:hypothetical protein